MLSVSRMCILSSTFEPTGECALFEQLSSHKASESDKGCGGMQAGPGPSREEKRQCLEQDQARERHRRKGRAEAAKQREIDRAAALRARPPSRVAAGAARLARLRHGAKDTQQPAAQKAAEAQAANETVAEVVESAQKTTDASEVRQFARKLQLGD